VEDGRLLHRYRRGTASIPAFLDDYAFLTHGLLELYEATFETRWLVEAKRLAGEMVRLFRDPEDGGFFFTGRDGETLVVRTKELYDGAIPSGNSVATLALARLGRLTDDAGPTGAAEESLALFSDQLDRFPMGFPFMLMALDFAHGPTREIVLAGSPGDETLEGMVELVHGRFLPRTVLALRPEGEGAPAIEALAPYLAAQTARDGRATAYVCENHACREPVTGLAELRRLLAGR
jgi:uncharacterized protein YyaL (SSP411 family)